MEERLVKAYERMMMPDDCTRRIEQKLERELKSRKKGNGRFTMALSPAPRRSGWAAAAALVCLVLVLSVGGSILFLNAGNWGSGSKLTPVSPSFETSGETLGNAPQSFVLSEDGKAFLEKMCYYMPDWSGYGSLDEAFWKDFLFLSFTSPEWVEDGKAMTICGETEYAYLQRDGMDMSEGQVKVSREAVEAYVKLAMGCGLPELEPAYEAMEPGQTAFYYEDGYYYIGSSDFGSVGYTFRDCEVHEETYDTYAFVTFDVFVDGQDNVIGTDVFQIYPADNENGFTVAGKTYTSVDGPDREETDTLTTFFAGAYFSGDTEAMRQYLADSYSGAVAGYGGAEGAEITGKTGLPAPGEERSVGAEETVSVQFKESPAADSYTYLTMVLVKQEDGWKVKFYGLEK